MSPGAKIDEETLPPTAAAQRADNASEIALTSDAFGVIHQPTRTVWLSVVFRFVFPITGFTCRRVLRRGRLCCRSIRQNAEKMWVFGVPRCGDHLALSRRTRTRSPVIHGSTRL